MRTVAERAAGEFVDVLPTKEEGIRINGVPATLETIRKADVRVDLQAGTRTFIVEHVLGPLRLCGVTAADIVGTADSWDFARPEHRFCYSTGAGPDAVVGHPAGLPNPGLAEAIERAGTASLDRGSRTTVNEPVSHSANGGEITLTPKEYGTGVDLSLEYRNASISLSVPPEGASARTIEDVTTATTPYLAPSPEEAVTHAVADVLSDVVVLGGIDDVAIEAELADAYHALTVGVARRADETNRIVEHTRTDE